MVKTNKMISIIVPVYKVETYLRQCIDSILCQTYRDLEILLIDDGSPDKCGRICEEYAEIDSRIRVFHTENGGLSAARNFGLRKANGEYVGFVDSDDWIEPDMYEILLRRLEETGTSICACGVWNEYRNRKEEFHVEDGIHTGPDAIRALICKQPNYAWNKLYRKSFWIDVSFPENRTFEDIATIYKVVLKAGSLSCVSNPLYHYRLRAGSIVHTQSMENLMDYWNALYIRKSFLSTLPEFRDDSEFMDCLEKQIAFATVRIWMRTYGIPKDKRDYVFLHRVSSYVQKKIPSFRKKNWGFLLNTCLFFSKYTNEFLFAILYKTGIVWRSIKYMRKTPFPSA